MEALTDHIQTIKNLLSDYDPYNCDPLFSYTLLSLQKGITWEDQIAKHGQKSTISIRGKAYFDSGLYGPQVPPCIVSM